MTMANPQLMGVVNVTPDSFSDGGRFFDPAAAVAHGKEMAKAGAAILDLGAEASSFFRAGIEPISADEQLRRLIPVVHGLAGVAPLSIDTRSAAVARATLQLGARMINDVSAGMHDPAMLATVAATDGQLVLMHISPSYPDNPPTDDADILATVGEFLDRRIDAAVAAGVPKARLLIDPGLGFGKTVADNWRLVMEISRLRSLGCKMVVGASRKRFLQGMAEVPRRDVFAPILQALSSLTHLASHERDMATAAVTLLLARQGVEIIRVHNMPLAAASAALLL